MIIELFKEWLAFLPIIIVACFFVALIEEEIRYARLTGKWIWRKK